MTSVSDANISGQHARLRLPRCVMGRGVPCGVPHIRGEVTDGPQQLTDGLGVFKARILQLYAVASSSSVALQASLNDAMIRPRIQPARLLLITIRLQA